MSACPATTISEEHSSLFQRLGGHAAVNAAVDVFYDRILKDERLAPFFEGVAMATQKAKQAAFLTYVFGGPNEYRGRDLRSAHLRLIEEKGMNESHFDMVAVHLKETLEGLGVSADLVSEVINLAATTKPIIFGHIEKK